jgi:hypothetical protein
MFCKVVAFMNRPRALLDTQLLKLYDSQWSDQPEFVDYNPTFLAEALPGIMELG